MGYLEIMSLFVLRSLSVNSSNHKFVFTMQTVQYWSFAKVLKTQFPHL